MLPHELAQKHHEDVELALRSTCVIDKDNFLRKYNGKAYWAKMQELGHSSSNPLECKCGAKVHYLGK